MSDFHEIHFGGQKRYQQQDIPRLKKFFDFHFGKGPYLRLKWTNFFYLDIKIHTTMESPDRVD
jgi:hypothetical protein